MCIQYQQSEQQCSYCTRVHIQYDKHQIVHIGYVHIYNMKNKNNNLHLAYVCIYIYNMTNIILLILYMCICAIWTIQITVFILDCCDQQSFCGYSSTWINVSKIIVHCLLISDYSSLMSDDWSLLFYGWIRA
jgi:hypothetical protein